MMASEQPALVLQSVARVESIWAAVRLEPEEGENDAVALIRGWTQDERVESELRVSKNAEQDEVMFDGMRVELVW